MTPCGFYLLFCHDLVCTQECVCVCLRLCICIHCSRSFVHVCVCACQKCWCCISQLDNHKYITPGLPFLSESNATSHLSDAIVKNQRRSHALSFSPLFSLCTWICFTLHSQRACQRCLMFQWWQDTCIEWTWTLNMDKMWCSLMSL